jgi:23S rRNA (guanosine2251-2'-O)-methyltransferase
MSQHQQDTEYIVGRHAVERALLETPERVSELLIARGEKGAAITRIMQKAKSAGIKMRKVERERLDNISKRANHQGLALRLSGHQYSDFSKICEAAQDRGAHGLVVVADHIQDPHNLGAIIRSAAAAGAQGLIIPKDRACPLSAAVAKAAAGALSSLPVARVANLSQALDSLKQCGLWAMAAATRGAPDPWQQDLNLPLALVVGSEHKGVGQRLMKACDLAATLPLASGSESLNASVAAGILLFEIVRQRRMAE